MWGPYFGGNVRQQYSTALASSTEGSTEWYVQGEEKYDGNVASIWIRLCVDQNFKCSCWFSTWLSSHLEASRVISLSGGSCHKHCVSVLVFEAAPFNGWDCKTIHFNRERDLTKPLLNLRREWRKDMNTMWANPTFRNAFHIWLLIFPWTSVGVW